MSERDPIEYLLNAMEQAAQEDEPHKHDYAGKRVAVLAAIADLRKDAERYRWIRLSLNNLYGASNEQLDAHIDAAIRQTGDGPR